MNVDGEFESWNESYGKYSSVHDAFMPPNFLSCKWKKPLEEKDTRYIKRKRRDGDIHVQEGSGIEILCISDHIDQ